MNRIDHGLRSETGNSTPAWAPRLAQEKRLAELDRLLGGQSFDGMTADLAIERAVLLGALNRDDDAKLAFIDILRQMPTRFNALNAFGALLTKTGAIAAACRVYSEAIQHHPDRPDAHINLANLLLRAAKYGEAREHYEAALRLDPDNAQAHQGMGAVLSDLGERAQARLHFERGFKDCAISTLPYRGDRPPIQLLQLVAAGGGNIPTNPFLHDTIFQTSVIVVDFLDGAAPLPPHHFIFNTIGDADLCEFALKRALEITARATVPVLNPPAAVMKTGRISNAQRLAKLPGVVTALTLSMQRDALTAADGVAMIETNGLRFPLLLRSLGYHTGRNFVMVESEADLASAAASLPGDELLAMTYLDARGRDGSARKYRVMMIGGRLYPMHLAISPDWKVHYFTSAMAGNAEHRAEEAAFLEDMPKVLGPKAMTALEGIRDALGLDYAGIDFGVNAKGELLLFEANATMVINPPDGDARWAYRRKAINTIIDAVVALLKDTGQPR